CKVPSILERVYENAGSIFKHDNETCEILGHLADNPDTPEAVLSKIANDAPRFPEDIGKDILRRVSGNPGAGISLLETIKKNSETRNDIDIVSVASKTQENIVRKNVYSLVNRIVPLSRAKMLSGEAVLVPIDISCMPGEHKKLGGATLLKRALEGIASTEGLGAIRFIVGDGAADLETKLRDAIESAGNSGVKVKNSDIIMLGAKDVIFDDVFTYLRADNDPEKNAFFGTIHPDLSSGHGFFDLLNVINAALAIAFSMSDPAAMDNERLTISPQTDIKNVRSILFVPKAYPLDIDQVSYYYGLQASFLVAA
ncbi:MAG: hypothetical protein WCV56_06100, partial [Candidatus Omnitrophota bacterium]